MQVSLEVCKGFLRLCAQKNQAGQGSVTKPMTTAFLASPLSNILRACPSSLQAELGQGSELPQRYFKQRPHDNGMFILPLKQSFMTDPRLMPGTRCMLAMLVGWAGQGAPLELTESTIAKHIGRSVRQVYRYLQDAVREGYLRYFHTKNRMGMITGIKVWLTFDLIRSIKSKTKQKSPRNGRKLDRTQKSEINKTNIYTVKKDRELEDRLERLRSLIDH